MEKSCINSVVHWKTKHMGLEKQECEKYLANKSFKIRRKVTEHLIVQSEHLLNLAAQLCIVSQSGVSWPCNCGIWFSGAVFTLTVSHHRHHWRVLRGVGSTGSTGIRRHFYDSSGKVSSFGHKIVQGSSVKTPWVPPPPTCPSPALSSVLVPSSHEPAEESIEEASLSLSFFGPCDLWAFF